MLFLDKPATIGDSIAWGLSVFMTSFHVVLGRVATTALPKFEPMFASIGGDMPGITKFALRWLDLLWLLGWILPIGMLLFAYFNHINRRWMLIGCLFTGYAYLKVIFTCLLAIILPILEMQKALS